MYVRVANMDANADDDDDDPYLPDDRLRGIAEYSPELTLTLARNHRRFRNLYADDNQWRQRFYSTYRDLYVWCNGRLPIYYRAQELLRDEQVVAQLSFNGVVDTSYYAVDRNMPWKRFYLRTYNQYARALPVVAKDVYHGHDAFASIRSRMVDYVYGVNNAMLPSQFCAPATRQLIEVRLLHHQRHALLQSYRVYCKVYDAPYAMTQHFGYAELVMMQIDIDTSRLEGVLRSVPLCPPGGAFVTEFERVSTYAANDGSDFNFIRNSLASNEPFTTFNLSQRLIVAEIYTRMVRYALAPRRQRAVDDYPITLLQCRICGPVKQLKWMHADDNNLTFCSDECAGIKSNVL